MLDTIFPIISRFCGVLKDWREQNSGLFLQAEIHDW